MGKGKLLRKGLTMLLVVVMIIGILPGVGSLEVSAEESGASEATITPSKPKGEGTKASPYQIGTAAELYWFADKVNNENATYKNANAVLTADITVNTGVLNEDGELNDTGEFIKWTPIGADDCLFQGTFNGQNHSISGLYFNDDSAFDVGLFGYLCYGNISNVGVKDSYFNGANSVGGLCGTLHNGSTITNCYNAGRVEGIGWVGGVCGANRGTITKCYSTGRISGTKLVGGLCGVSYGTITDCYSIGIVNGTLLAGGLCGALMRDSTITNCYYDDENGYKGEAFGQKFESNVENVSSKTTQEMHKSTFCTLIGYASYQNGICILCDNYQPADYTEYKYDIDGDKSKDEVYEIGNAGQLYWFSELVNGTLPGGEKNTSANAVLTQNITVNTGVLNEEGNLNDTSKFLEWIPIGTDICKYQGTFDGQNHTISGLYFNHSVMDIVGLFGSLRDGGRVINVGVEDSYFSGNDKVGSICGVNNKGTVENCYNTGNVSGYVYVGGVCGQNNNAGVVQNCYNTGNVNGMRNYVGGVCGQNNNVIQNCYNTGDVNGSLSTVGGVCGNNNTNATIKNCYYNVKDNGIGVNDGTETNVEGKTTEQFQSGEVAYLLQGDIEQQTELVWGQTLTGGNRQASPVLGGDRVYKVNRYLGCKDALGNPTDAYSNLDEAIFEPHKDDGNGDQNKAYDNRCDFCGELCHSFNDDGICEDDGYHQGVITITNYNTMVAYYGEDTDAQPNPGDFTVASGQEPVFTWYAGDKTSGDLPEESLTTAPKELGTYTLVVNAAGAQREDGTIYTAAELRVPVTIAKETLAGTVSLNGTAKYGEILTVVTTGITNEKPGALSYQWYRVDGKNVTAITGATKDSYTLTVEDVDKKIKVIVSSAYCEGNLSATTESVVSRLDGNAELTSTSAQLSKAWDGTTIVTPSFTTINETGANNENVTFEYKKSTDTAYTVTAPTDAGTYHVRVKVKADSIHKEAVSEPVEFTMAKVDAAVVVAPVAATNLILEQGKTVTLIDATNASVTGGQLQYALSEAGTYSAALPTVTEAGTYSVYYKVVGDQNHNDTKPVKIDITVNKKAEPKDTTTLQPPKNGDVVTDEKTKAKFEVTDVSKKEVTYNAPVDNKAKDITVPDTVTINGEVYKVIKISDNAFKGNKTVTTIIIGNNVKTIGKNAFSGCKKLKTIVIKSKTLTDKKISKKAFKGISKKTVIKVPKKKLAAYKKLLKKKGLSSKNKVKGY